MNKYNIQISPLYYVPRQYWEFCTWTCSHQTGRAMPHLKKRKVIKTFADTFKIPVLIETGTYLGEMVQSCKKVFKTIYSIELAAELARKAQQRFAADSHIHILEGDSGIILPGLLREIYEPILFWLDGHYSGGVTAKGGLETPIMNELKSIFENRNEGDVILIDDARCFTGENDYPTIEEVKQYVQGKRPHAHFEVKGEIICIYP